MCSCVLSLGAGPARGAAQWGRNWRLGRGRLMWPAGGRARSGKRNLAIRFLNEDGKCCLGCLPRRKITASPPRRGVKAKLAMFIPKTGCSAIWEPLALLNISLISHHTRPPFKLRGWILASPGSRPPLLKKAVRREQHGHRHSTVWGQPDALGHMDTSEVGLLSLLHLDSARSRRSHSCQSDDSIYGRGSSPGGESSMEMDVVDADMNAPS